MKTVGFVGWRGMVGSVLMQRMQQEGDLDKMHLVYFSTSQSEQSNLQDAYSIDALCAMDIIVSCQGGDYTKEIHPKLRASGWQGYWIDAASALRMDKDSIIILDPINGKHIEDALNKGIKNYIGGNCTVSLMLMGIGGLFKEKLIDWASVMSYQAASGAGAKALRELLLQNKQLLNEFDQQILQNEPILNLEQKISQHLRHAEMPIEQFKAPLAANVLPWIDTETEQGQTREEWKGMAETNKILNLNTPVLIDGICVRVPVLRCHSQALTIKLNRSISIEAVEDLIKNTSPWTHCVANHQKDTLEQLTPAAISGSLNIAVGRLRRLNMGPEFLTLFTVGDQLLWGAAEPLRRMLKIFLGDITI